jgi:iron complex transport system substrate-binding protein
VDWAILETLLALRVIPVAAAELILFREIAVEPKIPGCVVDLGLRGSVNFELLLACRPDLILNSSFYMSSEPRMRRIAPVATYSIYAPGARPFAAAETMTRAIGEQLGIAPIAESFVSHVNADLGDLKRRLKGGDGRPVIPINFGDPRHLRVFGADSMFGEVLARIGIANAWRQETRYSALAPIGIEALAQVPEAWIAVIPPVPPDAERILPLSAFWNALPNVRENRVVTLSPINPFGALPAAVRFGKLLVDALPMAEKA